MDANEHRNFETPRPIPLDYGGGDLPSDRRREADALASDFGGWPQITAALTLCAAGVLFVWLLVGFTGSAGWATSVGAIGFGVGLFITLPDDSDGWRRWIFGFAFAAVGEAIDWWIFGHGGTGLLCIVAFRVGIYVAENTTWLPFNGQKPDGNQG
jgi:hypothetical protein